MKGVSAALLRGIPIVGQPTDGQVLLYDAAGRVLTWSSSGGGGPAGPPGGNAYAVLAASFAQPNPDLGPGTVLVQVDTSAAFVAGEFVSVAGNFYAVDSVPDATHIVLLNLAYPENAPPATSVGGAGVPIVPCGARGADGLPGADGAPGAAGPAPSGTGLVYVDATANTVEAVTVGSGLSLSGSFGSRTISASGSSPTYNEFWVPDVAIWENTGVSAPLFSAPLWRVGNTLYLFGGTNSAGAIVSTIYSAPFPDAAGTVPVFTATGASLPTTIGAGRLCMIGGYLYMFGTNDDTGTYIAAGTRFRIYRAPIATPTVWSDTGVDFDTVRRLDAAVMIYGGRVGILGGWDSFGVNTARWTSIANPLTGWATTAAYGSTEPFRAAAFTWQGNPYFVGGFNNTNFRMFNPVDFPNYVAAPDANLVLNGVTKLGGNMEPCDVGDGMAFVASEATQVGFLDMRCLSMMSRGPVFPGAFGWARGSCIGLDGRIYFIRNDGATRHIWRSGRRKVFVLASEQARLEALYGAYADLPGQLVDGAPCRVSMHVRMGVMPWKTDVRSAF